MNITRLRVEEGFFDGLDLKFDSGLNVLIGGRGVGKTSIIELIRFGLGISGVTAESGKDALTHALAVLKSGQVTIDLEIRGTNFTVTRSASDNSPHSNVSFQPPIVFSQKEIEGVGLDALGRLALIDGFSDDGNDYFGQQDTISAQIRSLTVEITRLHAEIDETTDKPQDLVDLKKSELILVARQNDFSEKNSEIKTSQVELDLLHKQLSGYSVDQENLTASYTFIQRRAELLKSCIHVPLPPNVNDAGSAKILQNINKSLAVDNEVIRGLSNKASAYGDEIQSAINTIKDKVIKVEAQARDLRSKIEKYVEGAGGASRELGNIRKNIAQAENILKINSEKKNKLTIAFSECLTLLENLGRIRKSVFDRRKDIITELNKKLSPTIKAEIFHLSKLGSYEESLNSVLRGSGLKYKEIVPALASKISPNELLVLVNESSYKEFSDILGIVVDRGTRILAYLKERDLGPVLTSNIEDDIRLMLLDGAGYKDIDDLSIGQRCTVALSIVLENESRVLLIDQPEDHLDNEFIAETLIMALRQRANEAQSIVCSHNANIPVLGDANRVISLDSNGRRGFVKYEGEINSPDIKKSIETIMEGGKAAFVKRANFYNS